jgi:hypothetical protein
MLNKFFISHLFLFFTFFAQAQTANQFIKAGDRAFLRQDFISAIVYYTSALKQGADELEYGYKLAESNRMFHDYEAAGKWYRNTIDNDRKNRFPLANFWLAMLLKKQMKYEESKIFLDTFIKNPGDVDDFYKTKALIELQAIQIAPQIISDTLDVEVERLSDRVNSRFSEFAPFAENENKIYFSSIRYMTKKSVADGEKFYISKILTSEKTKDWSRPRLVTGNINSVNEHSSNAVISKNGELMFFTRCNPGYPADVKCTLFYSKNRNGRWQKAIELSPEVNIKNYTVTQPAIAEDTSGNYIIYFVTDRPGGVGNLDIWYTAMDENERFSKPVNAGNIINTPGDDITPFYNDSTGILYFSSDYHPGIGGFDVFSSEGSKDKWTVPVNAGFPVNSTFDDLYFKLTGNDSFTGFMASNRPGSVTVKGDACCYDIYSFNKIIPSGTPSESDTFLITKKNEDTLINNFNPETKDALDYLKSFLPLELYFHNDEPDPNTLKTKTRKSYNESFSEYIKLKPDYRKRYSEGLNENAAIQADAAILRFFEEHVEPGMENLDEFARILLKRLEAGDSFTLKVKGYTSPLAETHYNINLAHRRISSLINYFFTYKDGVFKKYLNKESVAGAKLVLLEESIGEITAPPDVSDDLSDKRKSVYSPEAAAERRIEIIAVDVN